MPNVGVAIDLAKADGEADDESVKGGRGKGNGRGFTC